MNNENQQGWNLKKLRIQNWHVAIFFIFWGLINNLSGGSNSMSNYGGSAFTQNHIRAMEGIMANDHQLSTNLESGINNNMSINEKYDTYARNIAQYVWKMKQFDNTKVPTDFALAYQAYLNAWENEGRLFADYSRFGTIESNLAEGFVRGLLGETDGRWAREKMDAVSRWEASVNAAKLNVVRARQEVENALIKHGAKLR